jgi:hypothetical protein
LSDCGHHRNERHVEQHEEVALAGTQAARDGPGPRAALIPIRKSPSRLAHAYDERRAGFELQSHQIAIGMRFLPAAARRLHHCRELGPAEPFDFLNWFDDAPEHEPAFAELPEALYSSKAWVDEDREVDIRLLREPA